MQYAFASIVQLDGSLTLADRFIHFDYSPKLLRKPFGFALTSDTLPSVRPAVRPTRHYPRVWIKRPASERQWDLNPPDFRAAQRTL